MIATEFETIYIQKTKHRKRCRFCNKLIADGESVIMEKSIAEKYYPVKGIMKFAKWSFSHVGCKDADTVLHND